MTYDDREREHLRRGLAVLVEETPVAPELPTISATPPRKRSQRSPVTMFVTAAAAVLVTIGGVALLQTQGSGDAPGAAETVSATSTVTVPTTSAAVPTNSVTAPVLAAGELPYVVSRAPGWAISYVEGSGRDLVDGSGDHQYMTIQFSNGESEADLAVETGSDVETLIADRESDRLRLDDASLWGITVAVVRAGLDDHSAIWAVDHVVFEFRASLDEQSFRSVLASLDVVSDEDWVASVPETVVTDRSAAVNEYLTDVPFPPGFDATSLYAGPKVHWYHVGAEVTGAVTCAWIEHWIEGKAAQDQKAIDEAVNAMATSRDWEILLEMATEGGFSDGVWEYADAIAGDGTVVGGRVLTVEESYREALGCW